MRDNGSKLRFCRVGQTPVGSPVYKYNGGSASLDPPYATVKTVNLLILGAVVTYDGFLSFSLIVLSPSWKKRESEYFDAISLII